MNRHAKEQHGAAHMGKPTSRVVVVKSEEEFNKVVAAAPGAVVADFSMEGCGACEDAAPEVAKLAAECNDVTVVKVDVDDIPALADRFDVQAMPTYFFANKATEMTPGSAKEQKNVAAIRRTIKCARMKK